MDSSSSNQEDTVSSNFSDKVLMSPPLTVSPSVEEKGPQQGKKKKTNFPKPCCFNTVEVLILLFQSAAFFNLLILRGCQWGRALSSKQLNKPLSQ